PEQLALLALFHVLRDGGLLVLLEEGLVELTRRFVVASELLELLFAPWALFHSMLVGVDQCLEMLLLALECLRLCFDQAPRFPQPEDVWARGGARVDVGLTFRLGLRQLPRERFDLALRLDHIGVPVGE